MAKWLLLMGLLVSGSVSANQCPEFLNYDLPKLHSNDTINLCDVAAGKPMLIVNTASHCGFTRQFGGLETLHKTYQDRGLVVVGFASNDFNQEAKTEEDAAKVCFENFGVSFTMIAPSYVTGKRANPVFQEINSQQQQPGWNFTKYLVDSKGKVVKRYSSLTSPDDDELIADIESLF